MPGLWLSLILTLGSCTLVGRIPDYGDALVSPQTGRSPIVTWPARFGFGTGFVVGIPVCILGAPITYTVHRITQEPEESYVFPFLGPSVVLGVTGTLVFGVPFDLLEFIFYRSWSGGEGSVPQVKPEPVNLQSEPGPGGAKTDVGEG